MTDVLIKRELLEDLRDCANECYNHARFRRTSGLDNYERLTEQADAILAAPRQPDGDSELREECERLRAVLDGAEYPNIDRLKTLSVETCREVGRTVGSMTKALQAERDTLRQQRNKMVGLLMEADASFVDGSEAGLELSDRIHAALAEVSK